MKGTWDDLAQWWRDEVKDDPAYAADVLPILKTLLPETMGTAMDLGCGEGHGMRIVGGGVFGCDLSRDLLVMADAGGLVVQTRLPELGWLTPNSLDTAYSVYLLDLIENHARFFEEVARVVRSSGTLVVVINHPVFTAPDSAPLVDPDGEVLWRWGTYFEAGSSREPAGEGSVEFFHRPMSELLTSAASHGWVLDRMIERGLSAETVRRLPLYEGQEHVPRLLGVRWIRA